MVSVATPWLHLELSAVTDHTETNGPGCPSSEFTDLALQNTAFSPPGSLAATSRKQPQLFLFLAFCRLRAGISRTRAEGPRGHKPPWEYGKGSFWRNQAVSAASELFEPLPDPVIPPMPLGNTILAQGRSTLFLNSVGIYPAHPTSHLSSISDNHFVLETPPWTRHQVLAVSHLSLLPGLLVPPCLPGRRHCHASRLRPQVSSCSPRPFPVSSPSLRPVHIPVFNVTMSQIFISSLDLASELQMCISSYLVDTCTWT